MPKFSLDGVEYNSEDLSDEGRAKLASLQFLELHMRKIQDEVAVYNTARSSYLAGLKSELEKAKE
jgi:hypothetical protein